MNDSEMNYSSSNSDNSEALPLPYISPVVSVSSCLVLSLLYIASLYIWNNEHNRDHPSTVKRRFCSVTVMMLFAPLFVYKFSATELLERVPFAQLLGFRWEGFWAALIIPSLLTMLLFLGPLCVQMQSDTSCEDLFDMEYWKGNFKNILWVRNHIIAPLSEEFVYRACMMPLLLQSFSPQMAVFITPLFFGTAHVHHVVEWLSRGMDLKTAVVFSCFLLTYTTLFGFYSAYLFARTGHFIAPFLVHAYCNHMGLPDLQDLWQQHLIRRIILICCYIIGFIGWILLLPIATNPALYSNSLYWNL